MQYIIYCTVACSITIAYYPSQKPIKTETSQDSSLQQLTQIVEWVARKTCDAPSATTPYWNCRNEISIHDNTLFKGERVIIPRALQQEMLQIIHGAHLGVENCKRRARDIIYWPGMNAQIKEITSNCQTCAKYRKSNARQPLLPHDTPQRPWHVGQSWWWPVRKRWTKLLYFSGLLFWVFEIDHLKDTKSGVVIQCCLSQFARHGIPDVLITDNSPQFASTEFSNFSNNYQFRHTTPSPHYPQSNGMAVKAVQTAKRLLLTSP